VNISNVAFTRADEIINGAAVYDEDGQSQGLSIVAGRQGVFQTAMTRCLLVPCACLLLPPIIMSGLKRGNMFPSGPKAALAAELAIIYASLQAALPAALAVFPQKAKISVDKLEPKFQHLWDKKGRKTEYLYANKGL